VITLYQLHWSHYVEKVRWALDYKQLPWKAVDVDPFTKREMQHLNCKLTLDSGRDLHTVPTIHDSATDAVVGDSSRILDYLEQTYPLPALYPVDSDERGRVRQWMLWLDSTLGLAGRRLGYTQIALEHPGILAKLFIPQVVGAQGAIGLKDKIGGIIIAGVLSRRFRFRHNRTDRVFEDLERCLHVAADALASQPFLVGNQFSAADLTLAALLQPVLLIPRFRHQPQLQGLWDWRTRLLGEHQRQPRAAYESELHKVRQRRGWALGTVRWLSPSAADYSNKQSSAEIPRLTAARNDQQPVGRWPVVSSPLWYLQLMMTSGLSRTPYH
jgi:glutathione S-transferase